MLTDVLYRMRSIFRRAAMERELEEEIRFHLEHQVEKYVQSGMSRAEAERRARVEFGGVEQVKEDTRDVRGVSLLEMIVRDAQYGIRVLRKSPGFTLVALLSLGLGIGANTAIFQLLDALRLRTLPIHAPQELAQIHVTDMSHARGSVNAENAVTYAIWHQIRDRQQAFSGVFAWADSEFNLSPAGEVRMVPGLWVSGEFFQVLGVAPAAGRLFSPADDVRGCGTPGAVISYAFWQSEFGRDPAVTGRKLMLNGHSVPILGVTAREFSGLNVGRNFATAVPVCSVSTLWFDALEAKTHWWLQVMGRLKPGWSAERAAAQLASVSPEIFHASLAPNYPPVNVKDFLAMKLTAVPAGAGISSLRQRYSAPLWILLAIAGLVLLIASANLANLMLARASARDREIAVRLAIGASRSRLVAQFMTESLLLAVSGAALGLLAARTLSGALLSLLSQGEGPIHLDLNADWRVLAFTAGLAVLTCLLFGLTPALRSTRTGPSAVLKSAGRGLTTGRDGFGLRRLLVASQVALSLVLLVGALLFLQTLRNLLNSPAGFRQEGVVIAELGFARPNPSQQAVQSVRKSILERVEIVPGVISVAAANVVPVSGQSWSNRVWSPSAGEAQAVESLFSRVSPGYFRTIDTPLLGGRDFNERDTQGGPKIAIVNQAFARDALHIPNPVGQRFRIEATPSTPETEYEIVGLVGDTKYRSLREEFRPIAYLALSQDPAPSLDGHFLIRSNTPLDALLPSVRRAISEVDPAARFTFYQLKTQVQDSLLAERLMATLSSAFGILAAALSAIGIYGVISYLVARRRNEIGIRMALGAGRRNIHAMVLRESGTVICVGLAAGAALSLGAATFARSMLFGLQVYDVGTLVSAAVLLALVALLAAWLPARRAAGIDPMAALRDD